MLYLICYHHRCPSNKQPLFLILHKQNHNLKKKQAEKQIQDARGERAQVRSEIAAAYAAQAETERHAKIIGEEIWEAQQKRVVEDLMLKKLRLEKLQAKRSRLQDQLQETEGHLGSLDSELSRRDVQSNALLQDALQHTDALREALQAAEKDGSNLQSIYRSWAKKLKKAEPQLLKFGFES